MGQSEKERNGLHNLTSALYHEHYRDAASSKVKSKVIRLPKFHSEAYMKYSHN
jgi:hypothetical protein